MSLATAAIATGGGRAGVGGAIPRLQDFDVSPERGFLPSADPLTRLPAYFAEWDRLADDASALIITKGIRRRVADLPLLDHQRLQGVAEVQRAALVLTIATHAYVWVEGDERPPRTLPRQLAVPYVGVSNLLGLPPVLTHATIDMYNWRRIDPDGPISLDNLTSLYTLRGGLDESWFFLTTVEIEADGAAALQSIIAAQEAVAGGDVEACARRLEVLRDSVEAARTSLQRVYENCDPHVFYKYIRPFLNGWKNSKAMPDGLIYEGVSDAPFQYGGGSAAQSSLIHAWDTALGVQHWKTKATSVSLYLHSDGSPDGEAHDVDEVACSNGGAPAAAPSLPRSAPIPTPAAVQNTSTSLKAASPMEEPFPSPVSGSPYGAASGASGSSPPVPPPAGHNESFLHEMRFYMPGPHREFLVALADGPSIRRFVAASGSERLVDVYNACLDQITGFRSAHVNIVATYIIAQAAKSRRKSTLAERGTGGTDLMPFLKQSRDETLQTIFKMDGSSKSS